MPGEIDEGIGEEVGQESGAEAEGHEPVAESAETPREQPTPSYMTREAFEEAMGGWGQQYQERLDSVAGSFSSMQDMIKQLIEANKPQPPPLIPDVRAFENIDAHGMREMLAGITSKYDKTIGELQSRLEKQQTEWQQKETVRQIHSHLSEQVKAVSAQHPHLQKPFGQKLLQKMVIAEIESSKGDFRKVNVQAAGQALDAFIEEQVAARVKTKMPAAAPAQAQPPRAADGKFQAPKAPAKGAQSKPVENPASGVTMKNFRQRQTEFLSKLVGGED